MYSMFEIACIMEPFNTEILSTPKAQEVTYNIVKQSN